VSTPSRMAKRPSWTEPLPIDVIPETLWPFYGAWGVVSKRDGGARTTIRLDAFIGRDLVVCDVSNELGGFAMFANGNAGQARGKSPRAYNLSRESLIQIGEDILDRLHADRETDQAI